MSQTIALKPRRRRFEVGQGVELVGDEFGPGGGEVVLLLPGGGQTRQSWRALQGALAERQVRTLALDLRGHGESSRASDGDYLLEAFARDLALVALQLGGRPAFVGASLGGLAAMLLLSGGTTPARALVLVDVTHRPAAAGASKIREFMAAHPEGFADLQTAADAIGAYLSHRKKSQTMASVQRNLNLGADGRWRWHWDPAFLNGGPGKAFGFDSEDLRRRLPLIGIPTLLIRGGSSEIVSESAAAELVGLVPNARLVTIPGATHMVAGDDNDVFLQAIADFLRQTN